MIDGKRVLAVIPARGGSKRAPRKNASDFRGKWLVSWSNRAALASKHIDRVVLSTEDAEIAFLGVSLGMEVIDRPHELASDTATNEDVLRHAVGIHPDYDWIVLLQPTSPLREAEDIDACLGRAQGRGGCISYRIDGRKNGAVYVMEKALLMDGQNFDFFPGCAKYVMPDERSLDIDHPEQLNS